MKHLRYSILMFLFAVCGVGTYAAEETLDLLNQGYTNSQPVQGERATTFSVTFRQASGSTAPAYYTRTPNGVRVYGEGEITISGISATTRISQIIFTCQYNKKTADDLSANVGTFENNTLTWTGNENEVTFSVSSGSGSIAFQTITVTTESTNQTETTTTFATPSYEFAVGSDEAKNFTGQQATTTPAGLTLTYASDKEWAVVNSADGTVTLDENATGIATITASFAGDETYAPSSASYTITLSKALDGEGTEANPYSVADALYLIANQMTTTENVYVAGTISEITEVSTQFGNATYKIKDADADNSLLVYRGKYLGGEAFTAEKQIEAGDLVVVCGVLKDYNGTSEFNTGNYLTKLSVNVPVSAAGYATLYYGIRPLVVPTGVEATTYNIVNNALAVSKTYSAGAVIPAGTAVLLQANAGPYAFDVTTEAGEADANNVLKGTDEATETTGGTVYYAFQNGAKGYGFYWMKEAGAAFTNGAHKAYIAYTPAGEAPAKDFLGFGKATAIGKVVTVENANAPVYNAAGQRVSNDYKGLVIKDGKKYISK